MNKNLWSELLWYARKGRKLSCLARIIISLFLNNMTLVQMNTMLSRRCIRSTDNRLAYINVDMILQITWLILTVLWSEFPCRASDLSYSSVTISQNQFRKKTLCSFKFSATANALKTYRGVGVRTILNTTVQIFISGITELMTLMSINPCQLQAYTQIPLLLIVWIKPYRMKIYPQFNLAT